MRKTSCRWRIERDPFRKSAHRRPGPHQRLTNCQLSWTFRGYRGQKELGMEQGYAKRHSGRSCWPVTIWERRLRVIPQNSYPRCGQRSRNNQAWKSLILLDPLQLPVENWYTRYGMYISRRYKPGVIQYSDMGPANPFKLLSAMSSIKALDRRIALSP